MKKFMLAIALILCGCSASRVDDIKAHAPQVLKDAGFSIIGYQGYQYGVIGSCWGGKVWYQVERNGKMYELFLSRWGNEYHIYSLKCLDAVSSDR